MLRTMLHSMPRRFLAGLCLLAALSGVLPVPARAAEEPGKTVNLLLIGQDRLPGERRARSDSIILCTFRTGTGELILTSFLRDLYVSIPGNGSNRINAAYTFGGIPLLTDTLRENFAVEVDGSIEVDFSQFAQIIDVLGGVELELRQDEAEVINLETGSALTAGTHVLSGSQALSYSRIRRLDADGDFSRTQRQRKVLEQLLESYRDANLVTVAKVLKGILPMITTDLSTRELLSLALELFPLLSDLSTQTQRIPADGTYRDEKIDGMCVLVADMKKARQLLSETISPK
ncbi:MAG: LCP family protein [Eubacteriales bacterium]|nr:LCP family protein [Eubacteriales bacterium]